MKFNYKTLLVALLLMSSMMVTAQVQSPLNIALSKVNESFADWHLNKSDIQDMYVSDMTVDKETGISRVYFQQRYASIKVNKSILNLSIDREGEVFFVGKRFVPRLSEKVNSVMPSLTAQQAVEKALQHLNVVSNETLQQKERIDLRNYVFHAGDFSKKDIKVELQYQPMENDVRLAWDMVVDPKDNADRWSMRVDAMTGEVLQQENWTIYCSFEQDQYHNHDAHCQEEKQGLGSVAEALELQNMATTLLAEDNAQYHVFPIPLESPAHGTSQIVQNPAYLPASPYGWHDTDGMDGAEYTITRGNNVWAWEDRDNNQTTNGMEPDGGNDLIFDFPYSSDAEPDEIIPFATTNLFYMTNIMHDFAYANGMDTENGSFQENNYGGLGADGDPIRALAQAGFDTGSTNNAFYSHENDGSSASINMFVWDASGGAKYLRVDAPASIGGTYVTGIAQGWGQEITPANPVTGNVAIYNDNSFNPYATDACEDPINGDELAGKIALIDRGGCEFGSKALRAENAGAIGVIICNFEDNIISMAAGADGNSVTIPVVFIQNTDCATIRVEVENGLEVTLVAPELVGPERLDGDLDNGIIAHEFGHGISIRMTCGPNAAGLFNAEQMGEGWSDFFTLVMGTKEGDTGDMRRGIGTFVGREPNNGRGIRRYPYSTDMSINPLTYGDVANNTEVHALGEVWTAMIWDLYWAMVDEYGWDADVYEGTGGNNKAVRLVFEGLKNQSCSPGFIDGRDAILAADQTLYNGENQCLIWEVFARRGAGYYADQGSPDVATDQTENFDPLPTCVKTIKVTKEVTSLVNAGDDIDVTIKVINHKDEAVTDVIVTDVIPEGTSYVSGSGSIEGTVSGNELVFNLGNSLEYDSELIITYKLSTAGDLKSIRKYYNDMEGDVENWFNNTFDEEDATNPWSITTASSNSGEKSWFINDIAVESQDALVNIEPILIDADNPVIRFYHNYDTESGADAGIFEVTTNEDVFEAIWTRVDGKFFRHDYPGFVQYGTFVIPNLPAFSGNSNGWVASYLDLSEYSGQQVYVRFRFATDDNTGGQGWYVDDLEFMDMLNYVSDVCVTSAQGDNECATPDGRGTIVETDVVNSTFEIVNDKLSVAVYPNPADDFIQIRMNTTEATDVNVALYTVSGQLLQSQAIKANGATVVPMNVADLSSGFYFVKVEADGHEHTEKVVIK